jgi:hypothetical protein
VLAGRNRRQGLAFDLAGMFDFSRGSRNGKLILNPATGQPK